MNPHVADVYTTNIGGVDWADRLRLYILLCGYLFCLCFNLTACNTYILEPESCVKCPQDIFCLELGKGIISNFNSWKPPASDVSLHVSGDPLTNMSTKINGHERQCIIVNSKAKTEIGEILWNSTQKYWCAHLRTLVLWELYLKISDWVLLCSYPWDNDRTVMDHC